VSVQSLVSHVRVVLHELNQHREVRLKARASHAALGQPLRRLVAEVVRGQQLWERERKTDGG
jgi:hypothetical protein